jgi:uncharacterized protein with FMN-binding domain
MNKSTLMGLVLLAALAFAACESESRRVRGVVLPELDLSQVEDGRYTGEVMYRQSLYRVEVRVQDHRIVKLDVLENEGDDYDQAALAVLSRVIAAQSLQVDAVSEATRSSKLYLMAAYQALTGDTIDY